MKRLTVGDIQIYFDDDVARYSCPRSLELAAVEKELEVWQEFVERWLDAAESPRPAIRNSEERELLMHLTKMGAGFKRTNIFGDQLVPVFRGIAEQASAIRFPNMTAERRNAVVQEAISGL